MANKVIVSNETNGLIQDIKHMENIPTDKEVVEVSVADYHDKVIKINKSKAPFKKLNAPNRRELTYSLHCRGLTLQEKSWIFELCRQKKLTQKDFLLEAVKSYVAK